MTDASDDSPARAEQRRREQSAEVVAALAMDVDNLASRALRRVEELERLDADPNQIVAARRAAESLVEVAKEVRRTGLLNMAQQRLL